MKDKKLDPKMVRAFTLEGEVHRRLHALARFNGYSVQDYTSILITAGVGREWKKMAQEEADLVGIE